VPTFDKKFPEDKILYEDDNRIVLLDGVLLNKSELLSKRSYVNLEEWLKNAEYVDPMCALFRGPFSGLVYEKNANSFIAFGNQTGDTCVFWYEDNDLFAVSSDFNKLFDFCRFNNKLLTFNETAANHILTLGFVVEGNTFANEIHKSEPGFLIRYTHEKVSKEAYHIFENRNVRTNLSLDMAINILDSAFRNAVRRCFDKDIEYGYRHLADMSGGLDSRMVNFVAKELGYKNITNISYSKYGCTESQDSFGASKFLNNEYIYKTLDDISFIYDIEDLIKLNYGLSVYFGITGGKSLLKDLNFGLFGLEHTGMLGDAIVGTFCKTPDDQTIDPIRIVYTDIILPELEKTCLFPNHEMFSMYYRGFQGAVVTHYIRRQFTETVSPFMDVEFIENCFSLPLEYRCGDKLYWAWLDKLYPDAAKLPTTHERFRGFKLTREVIYHLMGRKLRRKVIGFFRKIGLWKVVTQSDSMNPFDLWYAENLPLRKFISSYFDKNINKLKQYDKTYKYVKLIYNGTKAMDKLSAINVLGVYNVYFESKKEKADEKKGQRIY
jgi:asparagine synthase (glutamine-hydrolysing)